MSFCTDEMKDAQFLFLGSYSMREGTAPEGPAVHVGTEQMLSYDRDVVNK